MLAAHILHDGLVKLVAGHLDGGGLHHTTEGDDSNIRSTAADIHHHVAVRLSNIETGTDGGSYRLFNEIDAACTSLNTGIHHGALFHLSDTGGNADDDTGFEQREASGDLVEELLEHTLGHIVIGNDALAQGTNGHDVAGGTAQHSLCLGAHFQQTAGILINCHHGGLVENNALTLHIHQNGSGTQIDTDIFGQRKHNCTSTIRCIYTMVHGRYAVFP